MFIVLSFQLGKPLEQIERDYNRYVADVLVAQHQKNTLVQLSNSQISIVRFLMGVTTEIESTVIRNQLSWADAQRITISFILCDYTHVVKLGRIFIEDYPYEGYDLAMLFMFVGIANVALFKVTRMRYRRMCKAARQCLKKLDRICSWATESCLGKLTLLQAELSSVSRRQHESTVRSYLLAIAFADSRKNLFETARAHERYGRYLGECGDVAKSLTHLRMACSLYGEWNAYRKVDMLSEEVEKIRVSG